MQQPAPTVSVSCCCFFSLVIKRKTYAKVFFSLVREDDREINSSIGLRTIVVDMVMTRISLVMSNWSLGDNGALIVGQCSDDRRSQLGPRNQRELSTSSAGSKPWEAGSAGLSFEGTCRQFEGGMISCMSVTRFATKVFKR